LFGIGNASQAVEGYRSGGWRIQVRQLKDTSQTVERHKSGFLACKIILVSLKKIVFSIPDF